MPDLQRPRRSVLYMPASNPRVLEKAKTLPADALIFDLEDAVAPDAKADARTAAVAAVASSEYGRREMLVRVNGLDTPWGEDDLKALAKSQADGLVAPKINTAADVKLVDDTLKAAGAPDDLPLWLMIETAPAVLYAAEIATASARIAGLCAGTADLAKDLQCSHPADRGPMVTALQTIVLAARAAGIAALDGVHVDLNDDSGLAESCRQGRAFGFDGKTLIHPKQIAAANEAFAPSPADIDHARRLIAAHEDAAASGAGVTTLDGQLVERLHVEQARSLLAKADAIAALADGS